MKKLHLPDNIKIHFAAMENMSHLQALKTMGVSYGLYSAFPFVFKKIFGKGTNIEDVKKIESINKAMIHTIQDSGLFSLLYGSKKGFCNKNTVYKWYDALVEWTLEHNQDVAVVEIDCQDVLGTEIAWDLRYKLRSDLPNNRIINVFHLSDGVKGLDRLIEYSDYIAVGSGSPSDSSSTMYEVSSYIKNKNPDIDIHLLGCTINNTLKKCSFCTSADSTTWLRPLKYGDIQNYRVCDLDEKKVKALISDEAYSSLGNYIQKRENITTFCASVEMYKRYYQIYAGNQDFTFNF
jgi:hypothetical protein